MNVATEIVAEWFFVRSGSTAVGMTRFYIIIIAWSFERCRLLTLCSIGVYRYSVWLESDRIKVNIVAERTFFR